MSNDVKKVWPRTQRMVLLTSSICALTLGWVPSIAAKDPPRHNSASAAVKVAGNAIDGAVLSESPDGTSTLRIHGRKSPTFNVYRLSAPERLVIDLSESVRGSVPETLRGETWAVDHVKIAESKQSGATVVRVTVELERDVSYVVVPNKNELVITMTPGEPPPESRQARVRALAEQERLAAASGRTKAELEAAKAEASQLLAANNDANANLARTQEELRKILAEEKAAASRLAAQKEQLAQVQANAQGKKGAAKQSHEELKRLEDEIARSKALVDTARRNSESLHKKVAELTQVAAAAKAEAERNSEAAKREATRLAKLRADAQAQEDKARAAESRAALADANRQQADAQAKDLLQNAQTMLAKAKAERAAAALEHEEAQRALIAAKEAQAKASTAQERKALATLSSQAQKREEKSRADQAKLASLVGQLEKDRNRLALALESQVEQRGNLERELQAKNQRVSALEQEIAEAQARAGKSRAQTRADAEKELSAIENTHFALEQEVARLRDEAKSAKERTSKAQAAHAQASAREAAASERTWRNEKEALAKVEAELAKRSLEFDQVQAKVENLRRDISNLEADKRKLNAESKSLTRERQEIKRELAKDQAELLASQKAAKGAAARLGELENKVSRAQQALDKTLIELEQSVEKRDAQVLAARDLEPQTSKAANAAPSSTTSKQEPNAAHVVGQLSFHDESDAAKIEIEVPAGAKVEQRRLTPSMQVLVISNAKLPKELERTLDASAFRGPVNKITSFNENGEVRVLVASTPDHAGYLERKGQKLAWIFPKEASSHQVDSAQRMHETVVAPASTEDTSYDADSGAPATRSKARSKWHGERIDIELQDAPIKDVLLLFSDIGRVNIIAGKEVTGSVTMKLNAVPWDQALDMILRSLALGLVQEGNVIRVATQAALEDERAQAIARANAIVQLKPLETRLIPLSYATVNEMVPKVQSVLSPRGTVTPDTRTNMLIVMDVAENIALSEQLVGQLDTQTPQVLIEARIVEARTNWLRQLGIQWGFDAIASPGTGNPTGLLFPNSVGVAGGSGLARQRAGLILPGAAANPNYAVDLPAPAGQGAGGAVGFSFGSIAGNVNTNLRLSAAEEEGEVRLISAPKVVAMDNTEAKIEQGVQIPISQVSQNGVNTRYVTAALALQVVPHVTNEGSIILEVKVQKNEADFVNTGARGDPTILTKQAESKMLILDGDTAVIGGVYTRNQSKGQKRVPWLADIPLVGWFFKNKVEGDTRTELLIFLTPKIVNRSTSIGG